jgi:hypothetical protein
MSVTVETYYREAEGNGRLPPGFYNWLMNSRFAALPGPGDFFRGTDGRMWVFTRDLHWEARDE